MHRAEEPDTCRTAVLSCRTCAELVEHQHLEARLCPALDEEQGALYVLALLRSDEEMEQQQHGSTGRQLVSLCGVLGAWQARMLRIILKCTCCTLSVPLITRALSAIALIFHPHPLLVINRHAVQAHVPRGGEDLQMNKEAVLMQGQAQATPATQHNSSSRLAILSSRMGIP
jgi:hypothetical protein